MIRKSWFFIAILTVVFTTGCGVTESLKKRILRPSSRTYWKPDDFGLTSETVVIPVRGEAIHAWYFPADRSGRTVILFGGSSGNKQVYLPFIRSFVQGGYNVFLFDYRGYGFSSGEPSVFESIKDAKEVVTYISNQPEHVKICLFGLSLGSAIAVGVSHELPDRVDALILESLYNPVRQVGRYVGPFLSFLFNNFVLPESLDSEALLKQSNLPMFVMQGANDSLTPPLEAARLERFAEKRNNRSFFWLVPDTGHSPGLISRHPEVYRLRLCNFLDTWMKGERYQWYFRVNWKSREQQGESRKTFVVNSTLQPAVRGKGTGRIPVAISVLFSDGSSEVIQKRYPADKDEFSYRLTFSRRPVFVSAIAAAGNVSEINGGWSHQSKFGRIRARMEELISRFRDRLGLEDASFSVPPEFRMNRDVADWNKRVASLINTSRIPSSSSSREMESASSSPGQMESFRIALKKTEDELDNLMDTLQKHDRLREMYAHLYVYLSGFYQQIDRIEQAISCLRKGIAYMPEKPASFYAFHSRNMTVGYDYTFIQFAYRRLSSLVEDPEQKEYYKMKEKEWVRRFTERQEELRTWIHQQKAKVSEVKEGIQ